VKDQKTNKNASKKNIPISIKIKIDLHQKKVFPWTSMELSKISTWYTHQKKIKFASKKINSEVC